MLSRAEVAAIRARVTYPPEDTAGGWTDARRYDPDIPALIDTIEAFAEALEDLYEHSDIRPATDVLIAWAAPTEGGTPE